jgi:anti-sigma factor RsiW
MTKTLYGSEHLSPEQISAFVDRELAADERSSAEQHLAGCHTCTLSVLKTTQLKTATASAANTVTVPPDALARLTARLQLQEPQEKGTRVYSFPTARWMAIAACLLLAVSLFGWQQIRRSDTLSSELLDQHLAVMSSGALPEVISTDRHTVKPWFQGKLPFSFNLPEALPPDTTLKGGDLMYVNGHPTAMLLFTIHKHQVSVFLTQRTNRLPATERSNNRSGFAVHYATTQGLRIAAVSDVNPSELDQLLAALVQAQ